MGTDARMLVQKRVNGHWTDHDLQPLWRSSECFALLAGVGQGVPSPIVPPRGAPADLSAPGEPWEGWQTVTWYTLDELLRHDWQTTVTLSGLVDATEYQRYLAHGEVRSYSASVSGAMILVGPDEMAAALRAGQADWRLRTALSWPVTQAKCCANVLQQLEALRSLGDPADLRVILQFG